MDELDTFLAFYDFPAEHAVHLRATNPIESAFSSVRLRTRVTRGAGCRKAALAMANKLPGAAHARWHKIAARSSSPSHELAPCARDLSHVDLDDVTEHAEDIEKGNGSRATRRLRRSWRRLAAIPCLITG